MYPTSLPKYDVAIIGGGILGISISYWISSLFNTRLCVIEKEHDVAMHASSRNTGVVHSPFYLNPDTKRVMAKSALISYDMWKSLAKEYKIPWRNTGVFELALDEKQHKTLKQYMKWGQRNGIPASSMKLLDSSQVSKLEPNITCHSAIYCDREATTSFAELVKTLKTESARNGTQFFFDKKVIHVEKTRSGHEIIFQDGTRISASLVVNCAGGNSLDVAHMFNLAVGYSDLHFRGEYWVADTKYQNLVKSTIYTVAEFNEYPFLDPHWIKKPDDTTEIGPNAVPVPGPETYSGYLDDAATSIAKLAEVLTGSALRLLCDREFLSLISKEWLSSISKTAMVARVQKFIPKIRPEFFRVRGTAGIRSPVITPKGKFVPGVMELEGDGTFHIVNYNSPGATGAPAYSALVVDCMRRRGLLDYPESRKNTMWRFDDVIDQS